MNLKKIIITGICIVFFCSLTACGNVEESNVEPTSSTRSILEIAPNTETEVQTETSTEAVENLPIVSYEEVLSGKYSNKDVIIECTMDNVELDKLTNFFEFTPWYSYGDTYKTESNDCSINFDNSFEGKEEIKNASNGDKYQFYVHIDSDNSIGYFDVEAVKKITPSATMDEIKNTYKSNCKNISIENLLRSPDEYKKQDFVFSGTVFQILKQDDSSYTEFLMDTGGDNGKIFVIYSRRPGENRILENDSITIYGMFYKLDSYTSVLGTKQTVPRIGAKLLNNNN